LSVTTKVSIRNAKDLARLGTKSVTCKPCTITTTTPQKRERTHWTKHQGCGFCDSPVVEPYVPRPGAELVGDIGSCKHCKATFCRDHKMVGLVNCAGSSGACPKLMCEKCAVKVDVATHLCKECFFKRAERELST
jgi:hypothetical protein